jgi:poly(hydroxyalkanoate) depolymerase family esterase
MNFAADEYAAFVVYPEQAASANASRCWNWFRSHDQQRDRGEPSLIAGITREVMAAHNIDPARIYIAGLSAGGAAAAVIAETYPDIFAALGVHSGLACGAASDLSSAFAAMSGQAPLKTSRQRSATAGNRAFLPTIVFHGDRDMTVHSSNGAAVIARADTNGDLTISVEHGKSGDGHEFTRKVQCTAGGQAVLEEWIIHGAGHAWSGGCTKGSFTDPKGPNATKEMLRFFLEHSNRAQE